MNVVPVPIGRRVTLRALVTNPRVTVLMPVYNHAPFLAAAIESVLAQTFTDFELLIVVDGSTDASLEIASSYDDSRIRIIVNETNLGLPRSLNRGLATIESEYVARLDADDLSFPERLATQVAWLDEHPDVAVLGAQALPIDRAGRRIRRMGWWHRHFRRPPRGVAMEWYRMFDTPFIHSGVIFRRAIVRDVLGGYDDRYLTEEDSELWMRVARHYRLENLEQRLVAYRRHQSSIGADHARRERNGYIERKSSITHGLMRDVLRWDDVPRRWAELWVRINTASVAVAHDDLHELVEALDECSARFLEIHPSARDNVFIARHHTSILTRVAARMIAIDRRSAPWIVRRMFARHAPTALQVLPRIAGIFVLGEWASRVSRSLWRRR